MTRPGTSALRLSALASVLALILALRLLAPDPGARRASLLWLALGLGYGHQLGALVFARRRRRPGLERLLLGTTTLTAGLAFALALASGWRVWILVGLALLAAWHVLENDLALGRAALGRTRLPPLSRALSTQLATLGAAAGVVAAAWVAPGLAPRLVQGGVPVWLAAWTPEELIAALLLYHSASWLCRGLARRPAVHGAAFARNAPILLLHSVPLLALAGARELAPAVFAWAVSPPIYLFLSAAHAVHTCVERGIEAA